MLIAIVCCHSTSSASLVRTPCLPPCTPISVLTYSLVKICDVLSQYICALCLSVLPCLPIVAKGLVWILIMGDLGMVPDHIYIIHACGTCPFCLHCVTLVVLIPNWCKISRCHACACDLLVRVHDLCTQATKSS